MRTAAAIAVVFLGACVNPTEVVSQLIQFTPNSGRFISDHGLTVELRQLDQASYERFKVFYQGDRRRPEIIVLDIANDRYSFDARNWKRIEGAAAMMLVRKSLDSGRYAEAVVGTDYSRQRPQFSVSRSRNSMDRPVFPANFIIAFDINASDAMESPRSSHRITRKLNRQMA